MSEWTHRGRGALANRRARRLSGRPLFRINIQLGQDVRLERQATKPSEGLGSSGAHRALMNVRDARTDGGEAARSSALIRRVIQDYSLITVNSCFTNFFPPSCISKAQFPGTNS
jgi:hypothetical protein